MPPQKSDQIIPCNTSFDNFLKRFLSVSTYSVLTLTNIYFTDVEIEINLCQFCDMVISNNAKELLVHSRTCKYARRPDKSYNFVCYYCSYHTRKSDHMRDHIMRHTGEKPFQCDYCNYKSLKKQNLDTHVRINHT